MNLLYCFEGFPYPSRGGISNVVLREVNWFRTKTQFRCYTIVSHIDFKYCDLEKFDGYLCLNKERDRKSNIFSYLKNNKIDIVIYPIAWNIKLFKIVSTVCNQLNIPIILAFHGMANQSDLMLRHAFNNLSLASSYKLKLASYFPQIYLKYNYIRERYQKIYMCKRSKRIIHLCKGNNDFFNNYLNINFDFKTSLISNPLSYDHITAHVDLKDKSKQVLVVSRFEEATKRLSLVLDIWKKIEDMGYDDWRLIIVGDGESRVDYINQCAQLKLKNVSFEGRQNPIEYYKKASIFLMTSLIEGFGMTLIEAQQFGVVPLAFDTFPAASSIIASNRNGILIKEGDTNEYVSQLITLMECKPKREEMAKRAMELSKGRSLEKICMDWIQIFNKVRNE